MPKILSVLMPAYNAAKFLDESISSILNQSFRDFDFLILNDGSTDNSLTIIQKYAKKDCRIRVLNNKNNQGNGTCRNKLLLTANTPLIAWMDADDISLSHHLQIQLDFLKNNPDVDVVGGKAIFIGKKGIFNVFLTDYQIKIHLLVFGNAFIATMMRVKKIKENNILYNSNFLAEDYKFWVDCAVFMKFANLDSVLIKYRMHANQITAKHEKSLQRSHVAVMQDHFSRFAINIPDNLLLILLGWGNEKIRLSHLLQIKEQFVQPLLGIRKFYGYQSIAKNMILTIYYNKVCRKLGWRGKWFFIRSFGIISYFDIIKLKLINFIQCWFLMRYFGIKSYLEIKMINLASRYQSKNQK